MATLERYILSSVICINLLTFPVAEGIQCYTCSFNRLDSSNPVLKFFLDRLADISDERCKMESESDKYELGIRTCPIPDDDSYVYKCVNMIGTVTTTVLTLDVDYHTVERGCIGVRRSTPDYAEGCHRDLPASGPARSFLNTAFASLDLGEIQFSGESCYTLQSVSVPGLQCPQCTFNRIKTEGAIAKLILDGVSKLSNEHCLLDSDDDTYHIAFRNCPPVDPGYINKCTQINGQVTSNILGKDFTYHTLSRDCLATPSTSRAYDDGCHTELPSSGPVRTMITNTFSGVGLSRPVYDGNACYQRTAPQVASMATVTQASTILAALALFMILLLR